MPGVVRTWAGLMGGRSTPACCRQKAARQQGAGVARVAARGLAIRRAGGVPAGLQPPSPTTLHPTLAVSPPYTALQCVNEWAIDYFEEVLLPLDNYIR